MFYSEMSVEWLILNGDIKLDLDYIAWLPALFFHLLSNTHFFKAKFWDQPKRDSAEASAEPFAEASAESEAVILWKIGF